MRRTHSFLCFSIFSFAAGIPAPSSCCSASAASFAAGIRSARLCSQTKSRVAGTASLTLLKCCEACTRLASLPPSLTSPARRHPLTSLLEVAQAIFKVRGSVFKNLVGKRSLRKGRKGRDSHRRRAMPEAVRLGNAQGRFAATARSAGARASARTSASGALARSAGARGCARTSARGATGVPRGGGQGDVGRAGGLEEAGS